MTHKFCMREKCRNFKGFSFAKSEVDAGGVALAGWNRLISIHIDIGELVVRVRDGVAG
jgi:hypothetical protein